MSDETEAQESELREENRDHVVEESPAHAGAADVIYRHNSIDEESGALVSQEMTGDGKVVMCIDENVHLGDGQKITRGQTAMVPEDLAEILIESGICDEPEVAAKTIKSLERREARKG